MNVPPIIRIAITGVESTGKTTLTRALCEELGGVAVAECARYDPEVIAGNVTMSTLERLAFEQEQACQVAVKKALAEGASCVVSDTDAIVLRIWGKHVFGSTPTGLENLETWPDLTLLCAPTIPWEDEPLRTMSRIEDRLALHASYLDAVLSLPVYAVIDGKTYKNRLDQALQAFHVLR